MLHLQAALLVCSLGATGDTTLLDFHADWCGPCREMSRTVDSLASFGYPVRKVNIDHEPQLAAQYRVTGVPCFVLLVDGQEQGRTDGVCSFDRLKRMYEKAGVKPNVNVAAARAAGGPAIAETAAMPAVDPAVASQRPSLLGGTAPQQARGARPRRGLASWLPQKRGAAPTQHAGPPAVQYAASGANSAVGDDWRRARAADAGPVARSARRAASAWCSAGADVRRAVDCADSRCTCRGRACGCRGAAACR